MNAHVSLRLAGLACVFTLLAGLHAPAGAKTLDITPEPPDVSTGAAPNMVVTIDDSGSMGNDYMGDIPPFNTGHDWNDGPWYCAAVIDPRTNAALTDNALRAQTMNGVYYNPNIVYKVPKYKDSSNFPVGNANSAGALNKVWKDGIAANRPVSPSGATSYTDFTGQRTYNSTSKTWTDKRWTCPYESSAGAVSPLNLADGTPDNTGGPYYYRLKNSVNILNADGSVNTTVLYDTTNWEAVEVTDVANWANWYAYYQTRNKMARSSMSLAFDTVTDKIHVAHQNLNAQNSQLVIGTSKIFKLTDDTTAPDSAAKTWRTDFFNWVYQIGANDGTPNREATNLAGQFFASGKGVEDATNPYWEVIPNLAKKGKELSCRQNFHMLVTDGFWNSKTTYASATPGALTHPIVTSTESLPYVPTGTTVVGGATPRAFDPASAYTKVYWSRKNSDYGLPDSTLNPTLADLGFQYWATDLRPDLADKVPAYLADTSTNVIGPTPGTLPDDMFTLDEVYFNPANDPATWQHVTQYNVGLGVPGNLSQTQSNLNKLRAGTIQWPIPTQVADSSTAAKQYAKVDDTWHSAVNSRGRFFNGGNPNQLITALSSIFKSIARRAGASTALSISSAIVSANTEAYGGGYNTNGWAGYVRKYPILSTGATDFTPANINWDAGCLLTGGSCPAAPKSNGKIAPGSAGRKIFTSNGTSGIAFQWSSLTSAQTTELNKSPDGGTLLNDPTTWTTDTNGNLRLNYIRGDRSLEALTATPNFRARTSVLGAVINSQPTYVSSPGGLRDDFPIGSPENTAFDNGKSYEKFVSDNKARTPMVYVGANDGMLHAFDAQAGTETWAFIPNLIITNDQLTKTTATVSGLTPGVDSTPVVKDVLINGNWKTLLVGSLRMGGRGIYALDITTPGASSEATAASKFLWEFTNKSTGGANLGYTFFSANIIRMNSGKWGVVVSSGYFPKNWPDSTSTAATTDRTSLFVLDAETGTKLAEIQTPATVTSYGMSTPAAFDSDSNRTTDVLMAGDMAGNVWRFDATDADPTNWKVDNFFQSYESGGAAVGELPVSAMPVAMYDDVAKKPIWIFGTGKYLGDEDRIASNAKTQAVYGVRDFGTASTSYPIRPSKLTTQTLTDHVVDATTGFTVRADTQNAVATGDLGWKIPLNTQAGERVVTTITPLYVSNIALITTLIPNGDDPCDPKRKGVVFAINAASGGFIDAINDSLTAYAGGWTPATGSGLAGVMITDPAFSGSNSAQVYKGGGGVQMAGLVDSSGKPIVLSNTYWHRGAWRELMDLH